MCHTPFTGATGGTVAESVAVWNLAAGAGTMFLRAGVAGQRFQPPMVACRWARNVLAGVDLEKKEVA